MASLDRVAAVRDSSVVCITSSRAARAEREKKNFAAARSPGPGPSEASRRRQLTKCVSVTPFPSGAQHIPVPPGWLTFPLLRLLSSTTSAPLALASPGTANHHGRRAAKKKKRSESQCAWSLLVPPAGPVLFPEDGIYVQPPPKGATVRGGPSVQTPSGQGLERDRPAGHLKRPCAVELT